jgi:hypothetical protein
MKRSDVDGFMRFVNCQFRRALDDAQDSEKPSNDSHFRLMKGWLSI